MIPQHTGDGGRLETMPTGFILGSSMVRYSGFYSFSFPQELFVRMKSGNSICEVEKMRTALVEAGRRVCALGPQCY